jgi:hypothetical protein
MRLAMLKHCEATETLDEAGAAQRKNLADLKTLQGQWPSGRASHR